MNGTNRATASLVLNILNALALGLIAWLANQQIEDIKFRSAGPRYTQVEAAKLRADMLNEARRFEQRLSKVEVRLESLPPLQVERNRVEVKELRDELDRRCPPTHSAIPGDRTDWLAEVP